MTRSFSGESPFPNQPPFVGPISAEPVSEALSPTNFFEDGEAPAEVTAEQAQETSEEPAPEASAEPETEAESKEHETEVISEPAPEVEPKAPAAFEDVTTADRIQAFRDMMRGEVAADTESTEEPSRERPAAYAGQTALERFQAANVKWPEEPKETTPPKSLFKRTQEGDVKIGMEVAEDLPAILQDILGDYATHVAETVQEGFKTIEDANDARLGEMQVTLKEAARAAAVDAAKGAAVSLGQTVVRSVQDAMRQGQMPGLPGRPPRDAYTAPAGPLAQPVPQGGPVAYHPTRHFAPAPGAQQLPANGANGARPV